MFHFKQFSVEDAHSSMKVGTDAVLLGCWANSSSEKKRILDIGTGCGVISLMLAQRFPNSQIHAIDIDFSSTEECKENIRKSPFSEQIQALQSSLQEYQKEENKNSYDLIVSNPPFFQNSLLGSTLKKNQARHTDSLPFADLIEGVSHLLHPNGHFCCILPATESRHFLTLCQSQSLFCEKNVYIQTRPTKQVKRILLSFQKKLNSFTSSKLLISDESGSYTQAFVDLTQDFYFLSP